MRYLFILFLLGSVPVMASEQAAYDVGGRMTALLSNAEDVEIATNVMVVLPNGKRVKLQRKGESAHRQGHDFAWSLDFQLPDESRGTLSLKSEENAAGVHYTVAIAAESTLDISAIELAIDLPHDIFVKGRVTPAGAKPVPLATVKPASPVLFSGSVQSFGFANLASNLTIDVSFDKPTNASIIDRWDSGGRSYQLRAVIMKGPAYAGAKASLTTTLRLTNNPPPPPPAHLTFDPAKTRFHFDAFGGDYCWDTRSPIANYTLENLKAGWARTEMKLLQWDKHRDPPSADVRGDLELMRRLQQRGVPFVISVWWLPERFYTDAYEQAKSAHSRIINPEKWDELLDLIGGYLLYAKREYGVEPDLFSFNESNIGIYVGLTPETHMQAVKRIGAHFRKLGLKTKMLLGDTGGPQDTHKFVLAAASDPDALQYAGAVAFHSWNGGTAAQYGAWGDVAEWLGLPLLVTELGVDPAAYHNHAYDSYHYGLREARMIQELLAYARPQGALYWQFTNDYGLTGTDLQPTQRFWLMKHFTDLTPQHSDVIQSASDHASVLVSAFRKGDAFTIHILNLGASRIVELSGLPGVHWRGIVTDESNGYKSFEPGAAVMLPAKSLVSLMSP